MSGSSSKNNSNGSPPSDNIENTLNSYKGMLKKNLNSNNNYNVSQGVLFTTWTRSYLEDNNFTNILGIPYEITRENFKKVNEEVISNIINIDEKVSDLSQMNLFIERKIDNIEIDNLLYRKDDKLQYLSFKFSSFLNKYIVVTVTDMTSALLDRLVQQELIKDNQILVKEIHHRVKNNLQILLSLISLQERFKKNDRMIKEYLKLSVASMALLHSQLYSDNFTYISTDRLVKDFKTKCESIYCNDEIVFDFKSKVDIELTIEKANPILLMLNDLIISSMNNSFHDCDEKIIYCTFTQQDKNLVILYKDSGKTNAMSIDPLANLLVESLISQADGTSEKIEGNNALKIIIPF